MNWNKIVRAVTDIQSRIATVLFWLAAACLVILMFLVSIHTVKRWLFERGIRGAEELSRYLMVALVYLGLAATLRDDGFIRVDVLLKRLPHVPQLVTRGFIRLLSLAFTVLLAWHSWQLTLESFRRQVESIGVLGFPIYIPQGVVALGVTALAAQILVLLPVPGEDLTARDTAA